MERLLTEVAVTENLRELKGMMTGGYGIRLEPSAPELSGTCVTLASQWGKTSVESGGKGLAFCPYLQYIESYQLTEQLAHLNDKLVNFEFDEA